MKNSPGGILFTIFGVFVGILFIFILSPILAWQSQSQDRAKEFKSAEVVTADSVTPGVYVSVEGSTEIIDPMFCLLNGDFVNNLVNAEAYFVPPTTDAQGLMRQHCAHVKVTEETYEYVQKEVCSDPSENQIFIEKTDNDCNLVKELEWNQTEQQSSSLPFYIGSYAVDPTGAILIGEDTFQEFVGTGTATAPVENDLRYTVNQLQIEPTMLAAGVADPSGVIETAGKKTFVVSSKGHEATYEALKAMDRSAATMLAVFSALVMMIGFILLVRPVTHLTDVFRIIPFFGGQIDRGFSFAVSAVGAFVGLLFWLLLFAIVVLVKKLLIAIIILVVVAIIALVVLSKMKEKKGLAGKK